MDCSLPGFSVHGILQARTLEWVAISFFNAWKWKVKVKSLSRVQLFSTPWTAAYQAPPSMGFSRQEYWSGLPLPSPWHIIDAYKCLASVQVDWCVRRIYKSWYSSGASRTPEWRVKQILCSEAELGKKVPAGIWVGKQEACRVNTQPRAECGLLLQKRTTVWPKQEQEFTWRPLSNGSPGANE